MTVRLSAIRSTRTAGGVVADPALLVVGTEPPRSEPHLDSSLRRQAEGGDLLGQHHRIAKVVVQDEGPYVEGLCRLGRHRQGDQWPELGIEMVGDVEGRVAQSLCGAGTFPPVGHGRGESRVHRESEWEHFLSEPPLRCHEGLGQAWDGPGT